MIGLVVPSVAGTAAHSVTAADTELLTQEHVRGSMAMVPRSSDGLLGIDRGVTQE